MDVIPVLDLKAGRAVHARGGERERYPIVDGVLAAGDDAVALAEVYRDRLGCDSLYVADLDAIESALAAAAGSAVDRRRFQQHAALLARFAALELSLLVDAGIRTAADALAVRDAGATRVVVGLETLASFEALAEIIGTCGPDRITFSLDLRSGNPLGAHAAIADMNAVDVARAAFDAGAREVIVLDVALVGSEAGPPLELLARIRGALPDVRLLPGGGIRDTGDLDALADLGCAGALVATAIHSGAIGRTDIARCRAITAAARGSARTDRCSPRPPS